MKISKELLSKVYNCEIERFIPLGTDDVTYEVRFKGLKNGTRYNIINIYELVYKNIREWALEQGYEVVLLSHTVKIYRNSYEVWYKDCNKPFDFEVLMEGFEWVLEDVMRNTIKEN